MDNVWLELGVLVVLIIANGFFSASELGVVSSRKSRLEAEAERGLSGARRALALLERPGAFLATAQFGISLIGTVSAVFAGDRLTAHLEPALRPLLGRWAGTVADALVVLGVTFLSLVLGELAPKSIALRNPEGLAVRVAPFFAGLSVAARPVVWLLDMSTRGLLRLLGIRGERRERVTEEDLRALVGEATRSGTLEQVESERIERVLRFTDRRVRDLMTPRNEVVCLDLGHDLTRLVDEALRAGHDHFPVRQGSQDVVGTLGVIDLLRALRSGEDVHGLVHEAVFVPEGAGAEDALAQLRRHRPARMAVVVDEYGDFTGLLTATDLVSELLGRRPGADPNPDLVRRADGSYLADGGLAMHTLRDTLPLPELDEEEFSTLAGYLLALFGRLPGVGETVNSGPWHLEVLDLDGARIDRVLIVPPEDFEGNQAGERA